MQQNQENFTQLNLITTFNYLRLQVFIRTYGISNVNIVKKKSYIKNMYCNFLARIMQDQT